MIAKEALWREEVNIFIALCCRADAATILIVLNIHITIEEVNGGPTFFVLVEVGCHRYNGVTRRRLTLGGVAVTEAGCATETIDLIQVEEARFASEIQFTLIFEV